MCQENSPLFLQVKYQINPLEEQIWYLNRPLGKNSIGEFLGKARNLLGRNSEGKISNHSARKTTVTNLLNNNINPLHVQQITGHKKLESLNQYNTAPINIQKQISNVLSSCYESSSSSSSSKRPISNQVIPLTVQNEQHNKWNPVQSLFNGANITNCTFNINLTESSKENNPAKRRRVIFDEDDD